METLKIILKEFGTLLVAAVAVALVWPWFWIWDVIPVGLIPIGILYTISKPFYDYRARPWKERWYRIGRWILNVFYQLWCIIKYLFLTIGYIIDLLGNVFLGELIEDLVTAEEDTLFGMGDVTISAALGDLKRQGKLYRVGLWLTDVLSFLDLKHEDHCIAAIELYEFKKNQK
jgi:hypothetical protein